MGATMANKIRLASFNVENLFARPRVFNFKDKTIGDQLMERIGEFREILKKKNYTASDKSKLFREYTQGESGTVNAPLGDFIRIREDRGKFWKKKGWNIEGVKARGKGDWDGTVEFIKAKFSDIGRENTGRVFKAVKADIACIVEADDLTGLRRFDTDVLSSRYRYEMLIDGNDQRGIDVGLLSRFPFGGIQTHMFDRNGSSKTFSRDCPEYEVLLPNGESLFILCNHLKSKGYGESKKSNARRKGQAKAIAEILGKYDLRNDNVVVAGDLNDTPGSAPLKPLMDIADLGDVLQMQFPGNPKHRWTYHFREFEQIDYLLVSKPMQERFLQAGVERRGMYNLNKLTRNVDDVPTEQQFPTVTHWTNAGSDHGAVWADFDFS